MEDKVFLKQLGLPLKCQRIMKELSVQDVAKQTGLSMPTIASMEKGAKDFHVLNLKRLATAYGIELKEVM